MTQSIFSTYSQGENRVTSSIIQVLRNLPVNVVEEFLSLFGDSGTQTFINFNNQVKGPESVPDAEISANFNLLFETKIAPNSVNQDQLQKHLEYAEKQRAVLVYLTPDNSLPANLKGKPVVWKNFWDIFDLISELLTDANLILSERDQFLLRNLQVFLAESKLLPAIDEVLIVPASTAWPVYQKFGVYVCQAGRSFKEVGLLGFYANGAIQPKIARILGRQVEFRFPSQGNVEFINSDGKALLNTGKKLDKWLIENEHARGSLFQVFDLSLADDSNTVQLKHPIKNDLTNHNGRSYAYTQSQRYTSLEKLRNAVTTSDLN